jgi:hypothetical protein
VSLLIGTLGPSQYAHTFGGSRWKTLFEGAPAAGVQTILTLDLTDPRLGLAGDVSELPLCSHLWVVRTDRQSYRLDPTALTIALDVPPWEPGPADMAVFHRPFPLRTLRLRDAIREEFGPHYDAIDTFIGGSAFIRVRGEPLWLGDPQNVLCECGRASEFVASVGYETSRNPSGIVDTDTEFFLGELALYFFACLPCRRVTVLSQPT